MDNFTKPFSFRKNVIYLNHNSQPSVMAQSYKLSTGRLRQEDQGIQGHPWFVRKFEASLGYMRSCLKKIKGWDGDEKVSIKKWNFILTLSMENINSIECSFYSVVYKYTNQKLA